jgi:predicted MFS family arabinose efflux permease
MLAIHLVDLGLDKSTSSLVFLSYGMAVVLTSPTTGLLTHYVSLEMINRIAMSLSLLGLLFMGPSSIFNMDEPTAEIAFIFCGFSLLGACAAAQLTVNVPGIIKQTNLKLR